MFAFIFSAATIFDLDKNYSIFEQYVEIIQ